MTDSALLTKLNAHKRSLFVHLCQYGPMWMLKAWCSDSVWSNTAIFFIIIIIIIWPIWEREPERGCLMLSVWESSKLCDGVVWVGVDAVVGNLCAWLWMRVCVCVCLYLYGYFLRSEFWHLEFLESESIFVCPHFWTDCLRVQTWFEELG